MGRKPRIDYLEHSIMSMYTGIEGYLSLGMLTIGVGFLKSLEEIRSDMVL